MCFTPENFSYFLKSWKSKNTLFSEIQTIPSFLSYRTFVGVHPPVEKHEENHQNMDCVVSEYRDCVLLIGDIFQGNRRHRQSTSAPIVFFQWTLPWVNLGDSGCCRETSASQIPSLPLDSFPHALAPELTLQHVFTLEVDKWMWLWNREALNYS